MSMIAHLRSETDRRSGRALYTLHDFAADNTFAFIFAIIGLGDWADVQILNFLIIFTLILPSFTRRNGSAHQHRSILLCSIA